MSIPSRAAKKLAFIPDSKNIGIINRLLRLVVGVLLILAVFPDFQFFNSNIEYLKILPLFAVYPILTSIFGWDPILALQPLTSFVASINSNRSKKSNIKGTQKICS